MSLLGPAGRPFLCSQASSFSSRRPILVAVCHVASSRTSCPLVPWFCLHPIVRWTVPSSRVAGRIAYPKPLSTWCLAGLPAVDRPKVRVDRPAASERFRDLVLLEAGEAPGAHPRGDRHPSVPVRVPGRSSRRPSRAFPVSCSGTGPGCAPASRRPAAVVPRRASLRLPSDHRVSWRLLCPALPGSSGPWGCRALVGVTIRPAVGGAGTLAGVLGRASRAGRAAGTAGGTSRVGEGFPAAVRSASGQLRRGAVLSGSNPCATGSGGRIPMSTRARSGASGRRPGALRPTVGPSPRGFLQPRSTSPGWFVAGLQSRVRGW